MRFGQNQYSTGEIPAPIAKRGITRIQLRYKPFLCCQVKRLAKAVLYTAWQHKGGFFMANNYQPIITNKPLID